MIQKLILSIMAAPTTTQNHYIHNHERLESWGDLHLQEKKQTNILWSRTMRKDQTCSSNLRCRPQLGSVIVLLLDAQKHSCFMFMLSSSLMLIPCWSCSISPSFLILVPPSCLVYMPRSLLMRILNPPQCLMPMSPSCLMSMLSSCLTSMSSSVLM